MNKQAAARRRAGKLLHGYLQILAASRQQSYENLCRQVNKDTGVDRVTLANLAQSAIQLRTLEALSQWIEREFRALRRQAPRPTAPFHGRLAAGLPISKF